MKRNTLYLFYRNNDSFIKIDKGRKYATMNVEQSVKGVSGIELSAVRYPVDYYGPGYRH